MEITKDIIDSCGEKPESTELVDVGNDPNFIFENDPLFETVILYDTEGNVINVNSWLECAHYVTGGWSLSVDAFINEERYLFILLLAFSSIGYLIKKYIKNKEIVFE
jgi:hypothetical protein|tara:strand:+ start:1793 stop:2113 length:321 start_codon:yes stop_codon:yes gene_type:complete